MIREEVFKCVPCDYYLCQNCAKTQPPTFVGHMMDRSMIGLA